VVVADESCSGEEQLLEKVRAGVAAVEVFCAVEVTLEGARLGLLEPYVQTEVLLKDKGAEAANWAVTVYVPSQYLRRSVGGDRERGRNGRVTHCCRYWSVLCPSCQAPRGENSRSEGSRCPA